MGFRDLPPQKDPKGGSPKTPPGGISLRDYQDLQPVEHSMLHLNGSGIWKMATSFTSGLVIGLLCAWFTALQSKGVSQKEMQDYDATYSLYARDRQLLIDRNAEQDRLIGGANAGVKENSNSIKDIQYELKTSQSDRSSIHSKLDQVADLLQSEKVKK